MIEKDIAIQIFFLVLAGLFLFLTVGTIWDAYRERFSVAQKYEVDDTDHVRITTKIQHKLKGFNGAHEKVLDETNVIASQANYLKTAKEEKRAAKKKIKEQFIPKFKELRK